MFEKNIYKSCFVTRVHLLPNQGTKPGSFLGFENCLSKVAAEIVMQAISQTGCHITCVHK